MNSIPSAEQIRAVLSPMTGRQIDILGTLSGVPPTTIKKIRLGETVNPGINTVRAFMPFVRTAKDQA